MSKMQAFMNENKVTKGWDQEEGNSTEIRKSGSKRDLVPCVYTFWL
jgi:hypothetical protein